MIQNVTSFLSGWWGFFPTYMESATFDYFSFFLMTGF